jgi:predicted ATPase with chaperone activity
MNLSMITLAEAPETVRTPRVAGLTGDRIAFVTTRLYCAPHHTIADVGLIGGGQILMPGEVSRAHHGMLFLDERPECTRHVLEVLWQPLEKRTTSIPSPEPHRFCRPSGAGSVGEDSPGLATPMRDVNVEGFDHH